MNQHTPTIEQQKRDENIHRVSSNPQHLTNLLAALGVEDNDTALFLDAWDSGLYGGELTPMEYAVFKGYLGNIDFIERYTYFANYSRQQLLSEGLSNEEISLIGIDLLEHIEILLTKFAIFDVIDNPQLIRENFICPVSSDALGHVLVSNAGDVTYLLQGNTLCDAIECITTPAGKLKFILYTTKNGIVVYDYIHGELFNIPGEYYGIGQHGDISWVKTEQGENERLTVLETKDSLILKKYVDASNGDKYTRFHKVHHLDRYDNALVSYWGLEFRVTEEKKSNSNSGGALRTFDEDSGVEYTIRRKTYDKLVRTPENEEVFSCNGKIKEVYVTNFDTYIIYEETFYDEDKRYPSSSKYTLIYSLEKDGVVLKIDQDQRYYIICDENNFLVFLYGYEDTSFYNMRDGFSCSGIQSVDISQDERDPNDIFIKFQNSENGGWFYFSTKYSSITTTHDEETGRMIGAEIGRKNIH